VTTTSDAAGRAPSLLYFDHAASAPRRTEVFEAMAPFSTGVVGNPSGSHRAARAARGALDDAREEVAALTGSLPGGVVFTGGGSESCNLAVFGVAADRARRGRPSRLVVSSIEHHAVLDAADRLSRGLLATDVSVARLGVGPDGIVDLARAREDLAGADFVSVMTANNEVGTIQPLPALVASVRDVAPDAVVHTDAVAAAPWLDLTVSSAGADLVTICAHKLGGPVGVGALCFRRDVPLAPLLVGGGQERGRRSGTQDVAAAVGLATALRLAVAERDVAVALTRARRDHLAKLVTSGAEGTRLTVQGDDVLPGNCHLLIDDVTSEELLFLCDAQGLCASAASSCSSGAAVASHVLEAMGVPTQSSRGSLRLTIGADTTDDEVERAATIVTTAIHQLRGR
jgi:cysteine desulfurase